MPTPRAERIVADVRLMGMGRTNIMNVRVFLIVPAVLAAGVLAGCGQTGVESGAANGAGSAQVRMPSTDVCRASAYIRDRAPEGVCTDSADVTDVDDDLSPLSGR
jgi:hypothetical protein